MTSSSSHQQSLAPPQGSGKDTAFIVSSFNLGATSSTFGVATARKKLAVAIDGLNEIIVKRVYEVMDFMKEDLRGTLCT